MNHISALNLVLCIIILALGCWGYKRSGNKLPIYIGIAFGLFGISHFVTLLGFKEALESALLVIRTLAYLMVVFALYKITVRR